jgi:hypothetical protein
MLPGTTISVDALAQALVALAANGGNVMKAVSGTPDASYMHGIGGLFSTPGLDQRVFSAMLLPSQGLMSRLARFPFGLRPAVVCHLDRANRYHWTGTFGALRYLS